MFPLVSPDSHERVVVFLDVDAKEVVRGEVLVALETSICVKLVVVTLIVAVGPEADRLFVRGERASHCKGVVLVVVCGG